MRCEGRMNLLSHVETRFQSCKFIDLVYEIKKNILDLEYFLISSSKSLDLQD
jgi:hypothetical protein